MTALLQPHVCVTAVLYHHVCMTAVVQPHVCVTGVVQPHVYVTAVVQPYVCTSPPVLYITAVPVCSLSHNSVRPVTDPGLVICGVGGGERGGEGSDDTQGHRSGPTLQVLVLPHCTLVLTLPHCTVL